LAKRFGFLSTEFIFVARGAHTWGAGKHPVATHTPGGRWYAGRHLQGAPMKRRNQKRPTFTYLPIDLLLWKFLRFPFVFETRMQRNGKNLRQGKVFYLL
jgi:hypothetical protein